MPFRLTTTVYSESGSKRPPTFDGMAYLSITTINRLIREESRSKRAQSVVAFIEMQLAKYQDGEKVVVWCDNALQHHFGRLAAEKALAQLDPALSVLRDDVLHEQEVERAIGVLRAQVKRYGKNKKALVSTDAELAVRFGEDVVSKALDALDSELRALRQRALAVRAIVDKRKR